MAYSNGYDATAVLTSLRARLGWTDSTLSAGNKASAGGRKYDDGSFHAAVKVPAIKAVVPVQTDWDAYFAGLEDACIHRVLNAVFGQTEFKEQVVLYDRSDEQEEAVTNSGQAVGYRIKLAKSLDTSVQINSLQLYFDSAKTFNIYLYKQGSNTPVKTKSVTTVANEKTDVVLTDWIINYKTSPVYYLVYFQDDLDGGQALQEQACFNKTLLFGAEPFTTETTGNVFNRVDLSCSTQPYGLNMQMNCWAFRWR
jgi:hypothetical protein